MATTWGQQQKERRQDYENDRQMRAYLGTLTPQDRAKYLADRQEVLSPEPVTQPDAPQNAQNDVRRPFQFQGHQGAAHPMQAAYDALGPHAQARALQGMAGQAMAAIQDENDSRVAQAREARRMQHEKDIEAMRQEGLLRRLAAMQQMYDAGPGEVNNQGLRYNAGGGGMRVFNPNTMSWDYTDQIRAGGY